jgi:hypothetical protein
MSSQYEMSKEKIEHIGPVDLRKAYSQFGENGGLIDMLVQGYRKIKTKTIGFCAEQSADSKIDRLAASLGLYQTTQPTYSLDQIAENSRKLRESLKQK